MAGATNTIIQILRSDVTAYPASLNPGEQAYSYVSKKLFVGNTDNTVITIGGEYYVDLLDNATHVNTGNTIVRRDVAGNAAFKMLSVTDDASQTTDVVNKNYLDTRINALSSNTIYSGNIGVDGYSNVHTSNTDSGGSVIIVANNSTVATFTKNDAVFHQNMSIAGNLLVTGTTSYANLQTLLISNNEIVLNANATGAPLINAYITVNRGSADNAALIWNETSHIWQVDDGDGVVHDILNSGGGQSIANTTTLNAASVTNGLHVGVLEVSGHTNVASLTANTSITANTLEATAFANVGALYIEGIQVLANNFALPVSYGGTGLQSVTANSILYGNGTGAFGVSNAPTAGQVLQYRTDGVKFGGLDGGVF